VSFALLALAQQNRIPKGFKTVGKQGQGGSLLFLWVFLRVLFLRVKKISMKIIGLLAQLDARPLRHITIAYHCTPSQNPPLSLGERVFYCRISLHKASSHCTFLWVFLRGISHTHKTRYPHHTAMEIPAWP
jgi:hypothetical protein